MRKTLLAFCILILGITSANAQCVGGNRYKTPVFGYDSVMNLIYGQNVTANTSIPLDLALDIYLTLIIIGF